MFLLWSIISICYLGTMRNAQATEVTQRLEETGNQADYEDRCLSGVNEGELL